MSTPSDIRSALADNRLRADRDAGERERLVVAGDEAEIPKTELASLTGMSRQTIYDILNRAVEEKRRRREYQDAGDIEFKLGRVVEDRWHLRWRADIKSSTRQPGWICRSVGLRVWRTGGQLVERGPLTHVRDEVIFTTERVVRAQREAAQASDHEIVHDGTEDPEPERPETQEPADQSDEPPILSPKG